MDVSSKLNVLGKKIGHGTIEVSISKLKTTQNHASVVYINIETSTLMPIGNDSTLLC